MHSTRHHLVAGALVALAAGSVLFAQGRGSAQTPVRDRAATPTAAAPAGKGSIAGVLVTDDTNARPVARARVTVTGGEPVVGRSAITDDAGRFSVMGLPAGRFTVAATKAGWVRAAYGAKRGDRPGTQVTVTEGQQVAGLTMRMARGAVITGVITDETGMPAFGAQVRLLQSRVVNGERTLASPGGALGASNEAADDRGMYRFFGLAAGEYVVSASPRTTTTGDLRQITPTDVASALTAAQQPPPQTPPATRTAGRTVGYAPVYFPGTTTAASATSVTLAAGEERAGVDIQLQLVRTAKIEGVVVTPAGVAPQSVSLTLLPGGSASPPPAGLTVITRVAAGPDGKFSYAGIAPGLYTISARTGGGRGAMTMVSSPGMAITEGRIEMMTRELAAAGGGVPGGRGGPPPGPAGPSLWAMADINVSGDDISGISLSLEPGMTITGRIVFEGAAPTRDLTAGMRLSLTPASGGVSIGAPPAEIDPSGKFTISGVAPGKYRINSFVGGSQGAWTLKSAVAKQKDVMDFPLEIAPNEDLGEVVVTYSNLTQSVSGTLQDASSRPAPDFTIVVFAADKQFWTSPSRRIRTARPGTDGKFTVNGLPTGDYRIAAVVDLAPEETNDPTFLEQLVAASVAFTLKDGEKKVQDLRIAGGLD